jgi:hypothetical protein
MSPTPFVVMSDAEIEFRRVLWKVWPPRPCSDRYGAALGVADKMEEQAKEYKAEGQLLAHLVAARPVLYQKLSRMLWPGRCSNAGGRL